MKTSTRRGVLGLIGGGITCGSALSALETGGNSRISIEIHLDAKLQRAYSESTLNKSLGIIQQTLSNALSKVLSHSNRTIPINVSVGSRTVPVASFSFDSADAFVSDWESYIANTEKISTDVTTNLLLSPKSIDNSWLGGYARIPSTIGAINTNSASVVLEYNPCPIADYSFPNNPSDAVISVENRPVYKVNTVLHEVGHTLGFDHTMGTITNNDNEEIIVSSMIGSYVDKDKLIDGENYWGESFVEIGPVERFSDTELVKLEYNPRLAEYL